MTEAAAFNGAFAVQADGQSAANYTLKTNAAGGFYFNLSALNGQIIGTSQQYTTKAAAENVELPEEVAHDCFTVGDQPFLPQRQLTFQLRLLPLVQRLQQCMAASTISVLAIAPS